MCAGDIAEPVVASVLSKSVTPLASARQQLRTLGLTGGGAVVVSTLTDDATVLTVPLCKESATFLWLVSQGPVQFDLRDVAEAAERVADAHFAGLDREQADASAVRTCLELGARLPAWVAPGDQALRLLGLTTEDADPAALEAAVRREAANALAIARLDLVVLVALHDHSDVEQRAQRLVDGLGARGLGVRCAASHAFRGNDPTRTARLQVEACLAAIATPGHALLVEQHRAQIALERLRPALEDVAVVLDDPLVALGPVGAGTDLRGSLLAWLDAHGDTRAAAKALGIHINTVRYRLRRAADVLGTDLGDPDQRLEIHLRLRLGL